MARQEKRGVFLEETDPELLRAWHTFSDPVQAHPVTGEVWQYLGTEHDASGWRHCFRHRHHSLSHQREYRWISASEKSRQPHLPVRRAQTGERLTVPVL